jgi:hypothetical protein
LAEVQVPPVITATTSRPITWHFPQRQNLRHDMRIGVVLAGAVMPLLRDRLVRGQLLQPAFVVLVQAGFVVVDEDGGGNVHGVGQRFATPTSYLLELSGIWQRIKQVEGTLFTKASIILIICLSLAWCAARQPR